VTEPFDFAGRLAFGVEGTIYADTIGLLYKTPLRILGGSYAVTVALPVVWVEVNAQSEFSSPRGRLLLGRRAGDKACVKVASSLLAAAFCMRSTQAIADEGSSIAAAPKRMVRVPGSDS